MTANLKRYVLGERVTEWPSGSWNRIADAVERVLPNEPPIERGGATQNVIPVKNISTTDIPKGGVMMPTGSLLDIADGDRTANYAAMLEVDVPTLADGAEATYMIAVSGVDRGVIGNGVLMGPVWARVNVRDTSDKYAQVIDVDATMLESTASGSRARIIAKESGLGEVWALILLSPYRLRIRKGIVNNTASQTEIAAGGSGTVDVYQNGLNTGEENTWNLDWLHSSQSITTDRRAMAADFEDENIFTIFAADCEPEASPAPPGHGNDIDLTSEAAGTTQGSAFHLAFKSNRISVATATDSAVRLPATADQEDYCHVRNDDGADAIQVFPVSGGFINNQAVDTSESIAAGTGKMYTQVQSDHWISS